MAKVTLSSKYQIVIPAEIRQSLKFKPGQEFTWVQNGKTITLVPLKPIQEMMGRFPGINAVGLREKKDREI